MFKLNIKIFLFIINFVISSSAISQSLDGLKEVVSSHQEKIVTIESTLKKLIGSLEQQSNNTSLNKDNKSIEIQIKSLNNIINLLQNKINNITSLVYDLDFSLKRIERHLELSSINNENKKPFQSNNNEKKLNYKKNELNELNKINKQSLNGKTNGVLGFIKKRPNLDEQNKSFNKDNNKIDDKAILILPKGSVEDQYKFTEDVALSGNYSKAEKVIKEFIIVHKGHKKVADAQFMLGRVYYNQGKYQEATFELVKFNSDYPLDIRFQKSTLLIAEAVSKFADKKQACDILKQTLEFTQNPTEKFNSKINHLLKEKQCFIE